MSDFNDLLKAALAERAKQPPQSFADLNAAAAELNRAVVEATGGRMKVYLVPVRSRVNARSGYALVARFIHPDEERVLRVFEPWESNTGYPTKLWRSLENWEVARTEDFEVLSRVEELNDSFLGLISSPNSELVRLIANELAVAEAGSEAALAP